MHADKMTVDFSKSPVSWHNENPVAAYFLNALSLTIPAGEAVFMSSLDQAAKSSNSKNLKRDVKVFIKQESNHSKNHIDYNKWLAKNYGFAPGFKKLVNRSLKVFILHGDKHRLACTVALEFLTYVFSRIILQNRILEGADEQMNRFWTWHSVEEIEHKSIAVRAFDELDGSYLRRLFALAAVIPALSSLLVVGMFQFMKEDRLLNARIARESWRFFVTREKFLIKMFGYLCLYFIPFFRPEHLSDEGIEPDEALKEEIIAGPKKAVKKDRLRLVS